MPSMLRAERDEEAAEVLDVRLAGRVHDRRLALGERGRHDGVLRPRHGGLVEEDLGADEALRPHVQAAVGVDLGAEAREGVDVGVEPPAPDHVAAGRRHDRLAPAREQRPGEQDGRADARAELGVELVLAHVLGHDADDPVPLDVHLDAEVGDQLEHRRDVADGRDVREGHRLVGEEARPR